MSMDWDGTGLDNGYGLETGLEKGYGLKIGLENGNGLGLDCGMAKNWD